MLAAAPLFAADDEATCSFAAQSAYGFYDRSIERKRYFSDGFTLGCTPDDAGAIVGVNNWELTRERPQNDLKGTEYRFSVYEYKKSEDAGSVGMALALTYLTGNDENTRRTVVPYVAFMYRTEDAKAYYDVGFAQSDYLDASSRQFTVTGGRSLFSGYVWSQTRLYYIDLSNEVQEKDYTMAVEERLTWFLVPEKFFLTLYGLLGNRIYSYDPDTGLVYSLPDIESGTVGLTLAYDIAPGFRLFADVTHKSYAKPSINDRYTATYGTVGLRYSY